MSVEGSAVGTLVGLDVGREGALDGDAVGTRVGLRLGSADGDKVEAVGELVVGLSVG